MNYNPNKVFVGALVAPRIGGNDSSLRRMYYTRQIAGPGSRDEVMENASMCCYIYFTKGRRPRN